MFYVSCSIFFSCTALCSSCGCLKRFINKVELSWVELKKIVRCNVGANFKQSLLCHDYPSLSLKLHSAETGDRGRSALSYTIYNIWLGCQSCFLLHTVSSISSAIITPIMIYMFSVRPPAHRGPRMVASPPTERRTPWLKPAKHTRHKDIELNTPNTKRSRTSKKWNV